MTKPKVLIFDIETAPILGYVWSLWENNVALNQIRKDWYVLSWAAKWLDDSTEVYKKSRKPHVMYADQRNCADLENDKGILKEIWKLLDEADIVITQNGRSFDQKKLNARFILNGLKPPSPYRHIDTKLIASKHFAFTSNKLEYMTYKLNKRYKKLKHEDFGGFKLWSRVLKHDKRAWKTMERYNKHDVLSTEELYHILIPWDNTIDFNLYHNADHSVCNCGKGTVQKRGFYYTDSCKYQRFVCTNCGTWTRGKLNLFSKDKKASLRSKVSL